MAVSTLDYELRAVMIRQDVALSAISNRLGELSASLAGGADDTQWQGLARRTFDGALQDLRDELRRTTAEFVLAQHATSRALIVLAHRAR
ncbi:MAG: hypothetical protein JWQ43_1585 [Glaciihabitans sp.]|nr:hypothetical protein [Glaciihabitans sp.]